MVFRVVGVDTCEEIVVFGIVGINLQLEIAAIAESCANHVALVLLAFAIE